MQLSPRARAIVARLVALAVAIGLTATVTLSIGDSSVTITVPKPVPAAPPAIAVDGADKDVKADDAVPLDRQAQDDLETISQPNIKGELDEELREAVDGPAITHEPGTPLAAQEFPGCLTQFVGNSSSRRGVEPQLIVWHYAVMRSRPGDRSDNDALTGLASRLSSGVSWHFSIGREDGLCAFNVPLDLKAWTQANANPFSFGIEVIALGDEEHYVTGAGERKLLAVTRELGRRYGIPMRRGLVKDCRPVRSGIVAHADLGVCGGGHVDVAPWMDELPGLIAKAAAGGCGERCQMAKRLRTRHDSLHRKLRARRCAPAARTRSELCRAMHTENHTVHRVARRRGVTL